MVKPVATVSIAPRLPDAIARLTDLTSTLRFSWDQETLALFRRLDAELWEATHHTPVALLGNVSQDRLDSARNDPAFMAHLERVCEAFDEYMSAKNTWYKETH